jgi:hypothetical protein
VCELRTGNARVLEGGRHETAHARIANRFDSCRGTRIAARVLPTVQVLSSYRFLIPSVAGPFIALFLIAGCVAGRPATDTSDPGFPFGPTPLGTRTIAFEQDIKPIFDRDCLECHSSRNPRGNYSVSTYADAVAGQHPGDASSSVVVDCSPGGSMYRYFAGDAVTEASMVFRWMVVYNGAQTR